MKLDFNDYFICNDYTDDMIKNYDNYSEDEIFNIACNIGSLKKQLLDVLLIKCTKNNNVLKETLKKYDLYLEYLNDVDKSPNRFMKLFVSLFLENDLIYTWFFSDEEMLDAVVQDKHYNFFDKMLLLSKLTSIDVGDDVYKQIITESIKLVKTDKELEKLYSNDERNVLIRQIKTEFNKNRQYVLTNIKEN